MIVDAASWGTLYLASEWALRIAALVLVPRRRTAASARAWLLLILFWPWPGVALYVLIGRAYLPRRRLALQAEVRQTIRRFEPGVHTGAGTGWSRGGEPTPPGLDLAARLSEFSPVEGNCFVLLPDYDPAISRLVADIDDARRYVHVLYYILEDDATGRRVAAALERASRRGTAVRVLADAVGSRRGLRRLGPSLAAAGIEVTPVMPLRLWGPNAARLDLRNHRKIAIVDGCVAYFGSQNIVDSHANPGLVNEELAVRATGPVVRQLHALLLADRYLERGDLPPEVDAGARSPIPVAAGERAQVLPSGPGHDAGATEAIMIALLHGAVSRVVLTAPYVVPSEAFLGALCSAARRGVSIELIVDSTSNKPLVQLAQESYYDEMLAAGVRIHRRTGSFLHAKHMSVDDDIVLIGSSNLDVRSFALNAEVSVLIRDDGVAAALHRIEAGYRAGSAAVTQAERAGRSRVRRTLENLARLTDSVL